MRRPPFIACIAYSLQAVLVACMLTVSLNGCDSQQHATAVRRPDTRNMSVISLEHRDVSDTMQQLRQSVALLNDWLRRNPSEVITSVAPIQGYSNHLWGYVLQHAPGDNAKEACDLLPNVAEAEGALYPTVYGIGVVQNWIDTHPGFRLQTVAVHSESDGDVEAFVICYERP